MNQVFLIGNLTRDAEMKKITTTKDTVVANFTLAVDKGNNETSYIPVVAYAGIAEIIQKYTHKGSKIAIMGRLNQRSYKTEDDITKNVIEVICEQIALLDKKPVEEPKEKAKKTTKKSKKLE